MLHAVSCMHPRLFRQKHYIKSISEIYCITRTNGEIRRYGRDSDDKNNGPISTAIHETLYRDSVHGLQDSYVSGILEEHKGRACKRQFSLHPFLACLLLYFT